MTFFKGHLQRKTSDRKRTISLDTIVHHRKFETSFSKSAPLTDTEKRGSIDVEVERLFRQATDAAPAASHGAPRLEPSLFQRFIKCRENPSALAVPLIGSRRSFSRREHASTPIMEHSVDDKVVQDNTPDLIREGSYDSDALFITSPQFSTQSAESLHVFSPLRMNITNLASPEEKSSETLPKPDSKVIVLPPSERPQSFVLSIPKRRARLETCVKGGPRSQSLRGLDNISRNESEAIKNGPVAIGSLRKKSRFIEMFHHDGLEAAPSSKSLRKVSIGWMSEGKRCGYGYSFVDGDATIKASCEAQEFMDDSCERKAQVSSKGVGTFDRQDDLSKDEEAHREEDDKGSVFEIETISIPDKPSRWTATASHTRADRNESTTIEDGVIVRDFCTKASPDILQNEESLEEKKHHLMVNAVRQGFGDAFLRMIGLGKREIARYHAGLEVQAARSHECPEPMFEMSVPYWDHAPKEELGNYHIEAWRAAKRRSRQQRRPTQCEKTSDLPTTPPETTTDFQGKSFLNSGGNERYVGRRHSSTF